MKKQLMALVCAFTLVGIIKADDKTCEALEERHKKVAEIRDNAIDSFKKHIEAFSSTPEELQPTLANLTKELQAHLLKTQAMVIKIEQLQKQSGCPK